MRILDKRLPFDPEKRKQSPSLSEGEWYRAYEVLSGEGAQFILYLNAFPERNRRRLRDAEKVSFTFSDYRRRKNDA